MLPMSTRLDQDSLGLSNQDAARLGEDGAVRVRTFRLIVLVAQELRTCLLYTSDAADE